MYEYVYTHIYIEREREGGREAYVAERGGALGEDRVEIARVRVRHLHQRAPFRGHLHRKHAFSLIAVEKSHHFTHYGRENTPFDSSRSRNTLVRVSHLHQRAPFCGHLARKGAISAITVGKTHHFTHHDRENTPFHSSLSRNTRVRVCYVHQRATFRGHLRQGFRVQSSGSRVQGSGFRVHGAGFKVQGSGFRVQGVGCRVLGVGYLSFIVNELSVVRPAPEYLRDALLERPLFGAVERLFHLDRKVDVRLPGKENSNSHGARPVHQIIWMIKWIRASRLSIKNSFL